MPQRIVICFDGTWNTPGETFKGLAALHARFAGLPKDRHQLMQALEGPGTGLAETNVCRLFRAVKRLPAAAGGFGQVKWYDGGVGTEWFNRVRGGAFGTGLSRNIREGYKVLSETYRPGDEIFVFGFSRGAYTARSLVGMIRNCGLLPAGRSGGDADSDEMLEAYELYRTRDGGPDSERAQNFRKRRGAAIPPIKFLGVWDTVGALGIPVESFDEFNKQAFQFHDTELSGIVENAYHAVAVDEHRKPYAATLWLPKQKLNQTMEQRWFMGAHCDVGGGYEDRRLSDLAFDWMLGKAAACGLAIDPACKPQVGDTNIQGVITDSFSNFLFGAFKLFQERHYRDVCLSVLGGEVVDLSVGRRIGMDVTYRPANKGLHEAVAASSG
jgi:uncharacterized protein (DUF2235 family)